MPPIPPAAVLSFEAGCDVLLGTPLSSLHRNLCLSELRQILPLLTLRFPQWQLSVSESETLGCAAELQEILKWRKREGRGELNDYIDEDSNTVPSGGREAYQKNIWRSLAFPVIPSNLTPLCLEWEEKDGLREWNSTLIDQVRWKECSLSLALSLFPSTTHPLGKRSVAAENFRQAQLLPLLCSLFPSGESSALPSNVE